MRPCHRFALPLLLSAMLFQGCGASPPVLVRQVIPPSLLSCQPQPAPPDEADDTALALWIVDLAAAGDDCRGRLGRVKELLAHE